MLFNQPIQTDGRKISRDDLCNLINRKSLKIGIELGVGCGRFSSVLLKHSYLKHLHLVDKWNDHHSISEIEVVIELLKGKEDRYTIHHCEFNEALNRIEDNSVDFIYVDAYAHTGQEGVDFDKWVKKLRKSGILAGHDYDSEYLKTVKKINELAKIYNKKIYFTEEEKRISWYMFF